jgi:hypothetical protein
MSPPSMNCMRARSLASDGGGGIKYLARLRLAMVDEQVSEEGARCFLDLVGLDLGAEAGTEGGADGCFLGFRMERERSRLKPVRFTGGSRDGMGGIGMCAYAVDLGLDISTAAVDRGRWTKTGECPACEMEMEGRREKEERREGGDLGAGEPG